MMVAKPLSTALAAGFVIGLIGERLKRYLCEEAGLEEINPPLVVRAAACQVPMPHLSDPLSRFVRNQAKALEEGAELDNVLRAEGPSGARVYAFSATGQRLRPYLYENGCSSERLTDVEHLVWRDAAGAGGGWCAYLEDGGLRRLVCEYAYIASARNMFLSSGIRIADQNT